MLFKGFKGCFSPKTCARVRSIWVDNGGSIMQSEKEFHQTSCFFCVGTDDPWMKKLSKKNVIVLHVSWVLRCVEGQSLMPVSFFVLDDYFDPTRTIPASPPLTPDSTAEPLPSKQNKNPISHLKRTFLDMNSSNQDEDYSPKRSRPTKRQRTRFYRDPDPDATCQLSSPSPASRPVASSAIKTNTDLNRICERSASKEPAPKAHLTSCYSFPSTSRSFPFVHLGLPFPSRILKNSVPLQICYDSRNKPANANLNAFMSSWKRIANQSALCSLNRSSEDNSAPENTFRIKVSSLLIVPEPFPDSVSTTIFSPGKTHLGRKFWADEKSNS
ncbi:hypothetical protein BDP27DRAFT_1327790 [Rhodocollybia butyracea]|uniref:BRCT domain-containing protein n=1 Tax=Rhodocollybia butyracea TaxID=206335 RepID=A0A9P5U7K4_9AGAR|nr:hypothetical protein BDP27DRAFT_1327790 [Rhodocollybia butyracea]